MSSLSQFFAFLAAHPVLMAVLAALAVAFLMSVIKKIIKVALILFIIFVLAGGTIFHFANRALRSQGERILNDVREQLQGK